MPLPTVTTDNLAQLLEELVARVREAEHAVALSPDGLLLAATSGVDEEIAEQLSTVAAGLRALAVAAGEHSGSGAVRQIIVEMGSAFLFIAATRGGAILAVLFAGDSEVAAIAYEVALFAGRLDLHLPPFPDPAPAAVTAG
ncbi:roadblock/LC7 domain-containing protein [Micromonospora sp. NPDC049679]|uniref:roadblock/LC7 domain-containing protein n=1 Tax=Micromonospora sp. NPDC049679 TaxID=3155920 RepID=UPI0033DCD67C